MTFGELLTQLMEERGMSQNELARRAGLDSAHINMYVKGRVRRPTIELAFSIADALNVDVNVFRQCFDLDRRERANDYRRPETSVPQVQRREHETSYHQVEQAHRRGHSRDASRVRERTGLYKGAYPRRRVSAHGRRERPLERPSAPYRRKSAPPPRRGRGFFVRGRAWASRPRQLQDALSVRGYRA